MCSDENGKKLMIHDPLSLSLPPSLLFLSLSHSLPLSHSCIFFLPPSPSPLFVLSPSPSLSHSLPLSLSLLHLLSLLSLFSLSSLSLSLPPSHPTSLSHSCIFPLPQPCSLPSPPSLSPSLSLPFLLFNKGWKYVSLCLSSLTISRL